MVDEGIGSAAEVRQIDGMEPGILLNSECRRQNLLPVVPVHPREGRGGLVHREVEHLGRHHVDTHPGKLGGKIGTHRRIAAVVRPADYGEDGFSRRDGA